MKANTEGLARYTIHNQLDNDWRKNDRNILKSRRTQSGHFAYYFPIQNFENI